MTEYRRQMKNNDNKELGERKKERKKEGRKVACSTHVAVVVHATCSTRSRAE
jgi:hypothetical protein